MLVQLLGYMGAKFLLFLFSFGLSGCNIRLRSVAENRDVSFVLPEVG